MNLAAGTRLGPYEITASIGAGGMGEVYKARDTRLDRTVAVKVLAPTAALEPERRARFEREAKAIAGLNHAHICSLFDVGREGEIDFLVMEYLPGETLAQRLLKGPIPAKQGLALAIDIIDALATAHRASVIHRDLKPGNIMLTKSGAKLLDFGLAKLKPAGATPSSVAASALPTQQAATATGTILGTAPYMAPEQLEGREADARSDIFACGAVLYELFTGRRAFEGSTPASVIAAILEHEPPPITATQPLTPQALDRVVKRCLAKDPEARWQSAADLADELRWIAETDEGTAPRRTAWPSWPAAVAVAALIGIAVGGVAARTFFLPSAQPTPVQRWSFNLPTNELLGRAAVGHLVAISPDGRHFVYGVGSGPSTRLYHRAVDQATATPLLGTDGAADPFFSPDGLSVGFVAQQRLKTVALAGGTPTTVCEVGASARGAAWLTNDTLIFAVNTGNLMTVASHGGTPRVVAGPNRATGELGYRWPAALPGARAALVTVWRGTSTNSSIAAVSLDTGERHDLVDRGTNPRYAASGHLLFVRDATLFAVPVDVAHLRLRGDAVPTIEGILTFTGGAANYQVSDTGSLVYVQGNEDVTLVVADRQGKQDVIETRRFSGTPRLSPDGQQLAVEMPGARGDVDIWIYDLARKTRSRFTTGGLNRRPVWSPDGRWIAFSRVQGDRIELWRKPADFSGAAERLLEAGGRAETFTADGKSLLFSREEPTTRADLWILPIEPPGQPSALVRTPFSERDAAVSRDGRWLAYVSDESGRDEVYVLSLKGSPGRKQVSTDGGVGPVWSRDGRELFYLSDTNLTMGRRAIMAMEWTKQPAPGLGTPWLLFQGLFGVNSEFDYERSFFSVTPDGQRFLMLVPSADPALTLNHLDVVVGWFDELKRRAPGQ